MFLRRNLAYTLAEIMLSLVIIGVLIGFTVSKVLKQSPDIDKTRVKKAYLTIEKTITSMLDNEVLYPDEYMLKNLESVTTTVGDQFGTKNRQTKFRDAFMYYQNIVEEDISCEVYTSNTVSQKVNNCFKSSDGIVYGIPNTNFENVGVVSYKGTRVGAREHKYVPITVYPNFESKNNLENDTMRVGVRFDGKIQILNTECADDTISCRVLNMLHSDNVKREQH